MHGLWRHAGGKLLSANIICDILSHAVAGESGTNRRCLDKFYNCDVCLKVRKPAGLSICTFATVACRAYISSWSCFCIFPGKCMFCCFIQVTILFPRLVVSSRILIISKVGGRGQEPLRFLKCRLWCIAILIWVVKKSTSFFQTTLGERGGQKKEYFYVRLNWSCWQFWTNYWLLYTQHMHTHLINS